MKQLEERYIVIKLKHISVNSEEKIRKVLKNRGIEETTYCIVCESHWPMYEDVKALILADDPTTDDRALRDLANDIIDGSLS